MTSTPLVESIYSDRRLMILSFFIFTVAGLLIYRTYTVMFSLEYVEKANLFILARDSSSLKQLDEHTKKLETMNENIEDHTFSEIKESISKTVMLVNLSNRELKAQHDAWLSIKRLMEKDKDLFLKIKNDLNNIGSIKSEQILSIKKVIDAAYAPSFTDQVFYYIVTFIMGILSSIFATLMYKGSRRYLPVLRKKLGFR